MGEIDPNDQEREVPVSGPGGEERFRALTEHARDAIVEISPDAKLLYVSPAFTEQWGWRAEEVVGTNALELVHPDDFSEVDAIRVDAFTEGRAAQLCFRLLHKEGTWRWVDLAGQPYRTKNGEQRAVLVARDVTDRIYAERALQDQLEAERQIAELSRRFLSVGSDDFEARLREGLEAAARLADAQRVEFVVTTPSAGVPGGHYQWEAGSFGSRDLSAVKQWKESYAWSAGRLADGEVLHLPRLGDLPPEAAAEREALAHKGFRAHLTIPIVRDARTVGFLGFLRTREQGWSPLEIQRLELVADVLGSALRRLQAEQGRRAAEERFRTLTLHARDAICEISRSGRILAISDNASELCGYTVAELAERDPWSLVHPDDVDGVRLLWAAGGPGPESDSLSYRIRHRDGTWRWLESTTRPFRTPAGEERLAVVVRDVTDRQQRRIDLEQQLEHEKHVAEFSRAILESGADEIDSGIERGLEISARIAGADRSYLVTSLGMGGKRGAAYDWHAPDVRPRQNRFGIGRQREAWVLDRLLAGRLVRIPRVIDMPDEAGEVKRSLREDGIRSYLCIPINADGRLLGVLGFHCLKQENDWSPRELVLLRLLADLFTSALRRKRAEVGLKDSQHRLLQAQKMEAVGTLAGGIAHDFNNQLTVMLANARYALRALEGLESVDEDVRRALEDLSRAANHCAQLTRSLLHFSRQTPSQARTLDVSEVVADSEELLRPLIPSSIEFVLRRPETSLRVVADPTQLQQVLVNLVVNARDAMPDGGRLLVEVAARDVEEDEVRGLGLGLPGGYVEFKVTDTGTGMDENVRARIFEPFFTTKPLGRGTGLGLSTAYGIVEQAGGALVVESAPGRGATFRVLLPLALGGEPDSGPRTILLAEDEEAVRRLLARMLQGQGYRVIEASDGAEALRLGRQHRVDVVVTDVDMPRMGGVELARRLARQRPDLPVLFISGTVSEEAALGDPASGFRHSRFLAKPFGEQALLDALETLLEA